MSSYPSSSGSSPALAQDSLNDSPRQSPPAAVIALTQNGRVEMCSPEFAVWLGLPGTNALVGKTVFPWIAPEDRESLETLLQRGESAAPPVGGLTICLLPPQSGCIPVKLYGRWVSTTSPSQPRWIAWVEEVALDSPSTLEKETHYTAEEALRQSEERLRMIVSNVPVILFAVDCSGRFTLAQGKALSLLGQDAGGMAGKTVEQVFPNVPEIGLSIRRAMNGESFNMTLDMATVSFELWCTPMRDSAGEIQGMLSVAFDVTEKKKAEEALRKSEERYRSMVENQGEGACIIDENFRFEYLNLATEAIVGRPVDKLQGSSLLDILPPDQVNKVKNQIPFRQKGKSGSYELVILRPDGERRNLLVTATPRFDSTGKHTGSFAIFRDITDRKRVEDRLRYRGAHDSLTGLYNRFAFEEELHRLEKGRRPPVAVLIVDVDNLKEINDSYGHALGDEALRRVALALRLTFRAEDMIARLGGDEFGILLTNTGSDGLSHSIQRLRQNLTSANLNWNANYPISLSIGGVVAQEGQPLRETVALADRKMYEEKHAKRG